jgi:kynurenine formamidase
MKIIDMSHVMNVHTPGWVGYAGNKMYYAQNLQTVGIVAQRIDTAMHVGTHFCRSTISATAASSSTSRSI